MKSMNDDKKKVVVFDFDKTLTNYDTLTTFFSANTRGFCRIEYFFLKVLSKIKVLSVIQEKEIMLTKLSHKINLDESLSKYSKVIQLNTVKKILDNEINMNNHVIILSASPEIYIKSLFPDCEVHCLIYEIKKGKVRIIQHPYGKDKVNVLKSYGIDYIDSMYYDSLSDEELIPLCLEWNKVKDGKIIFKGNKK